MKKIPDEKHIFVAIIIMRFTLVTVTDIDCYSVTILFYSTDARENKGKKAEKFYCYQPKQLIIFSAADRIQNLNPYLPIILAYQLIIFRIKKYTKFHFFIASDSNGHISITFIPLGKT